MERTLTVTAPTPVSAIGGAIHQICFVTDDLEGTQRFLRDHMGTGRFRVFEDVRFRDLTYRGQPAEFRIDLSLAYAGDTQFEVIRPLSGPSLYTEFLERRGPGMHHLGFLVDDFDGAAATYAANGYEVAQSGTFGAATRFAYYDTEAPCGAIMELIECDDAVRKLFDAIKRGDF